MKAPPTSLVAIVSTLGIAAVLGAPVFLTKQAEHRYAKERQLSEQWRSNYMVMKACFEKVDSDNRQLGVELTVCQTNFQFLITTLSRQAAQQSTK